MKRRGDAPEDIPAELLHYRPADWPSARAWRDARRAWRWEHRPASLGALNAFYAAGVVFPPPADPREVVS